MSAPLWLRVVGMVYGLSILYVVWVICYEEYWS